MIKSVLMRFLVFGILAVFAITLPLAYFMQDDGQKITAYSGAVDPALAETDGLASVDDEAVIKLASLSILEDKPLLEILENPDDIKADTNSRIQKASQLAGEKRFLAAFRTLENVHSSMKEGYPVKFLEARILAWSGDHLQADNAFKSLRVQYPQDMDVMVSYGYLHIYQRDYRRAEELFAEVLRRNPDYTDARNGLLRAQQGQDSR